MQAVLFYADAVTIRAAAVPAGNDERLRRRLQELIDLGAVRTWAHEYEIGRRGAIASSSSQPVISSGSPDHVLTLEETRQLMRGVDEELSEQRVRAAALAGEALREGISEIVQLRHSVGALRLADSLGAEGVILDHRGTPPIIGSIERATQPTDLNQSVVREIVGRCRFGPLADLPVQAIVDCRRETPRFRALLARTIAGEPGSGDRPTSPHELAALILSEYRKIVDHTQRRERVGGVWDVVGAVLPAAITLRLIGARVQWFRYRNQARPFVLLGKLTHHHEG